MAGHFPSLSSPRPHPRRVLPPPPHLSSGTPGGLGFPAAALASLRVDMVEAIGAERARPLLERAGYAAGRKDALSGTEPDWERGLTASPPLWAPPGRGMKITPVRLDADLARGKFLCEYRGEGSWEAGMHCEHFGPQAEPVCWMIAGYASGFMTAILGRPILYRETSCAGRGDASCTWIGKPEEEWLEQESRPLSAVRTPAGGRHQVPPGEDFAAEPMHLIGSSAAFVRACGLLRSAAATAVTVLLVGETGTGKERFARALHALSPRARKPFIAVNCAALPAELIESELFGAEKGAYTGAQGHAGRFERADGGTLFLDEIGDLPLEAQAKLLRVLEDGEVERLGSSAGRKVDVRVVAATHRDLGTIAKDGGFRADLFYRLNVYPLLLPALREREDDVLLLAESLGRRFANKHGRPVQGFTEAARLALRQHDWPGNVRELENTVERAIILARPGGAIEAADLFPEGERWGGAASPAAGRPGNAGSAAASTPLPAYPHLLEELRGSGCSLEEFERNLLEEAVRAAGGNLSAAARILGITRAQLSYRIQRKAGSCRHTGSTPVRPGCGGDSTCAAGGGSPREGRA